MDIFGWIYVFVLFNIVIIDLFNNRNKFNWRENIYLVCGTLMS